MSLCHRRFIRWFYLFLLFPLFALAAKPTVPPKFLDPQLRLLAPNNERFSKELIETRDFIHFKNREWKACHQAPELPQFGFFAGGDGIEPIEDFIESPLLSRDLKDFEEQGLMEGKVHQTPWSGDYWPYANGLLGARFLDAKFNKLGHWRSRFEYIKKNPVFEVLDREGQHGVEKLSPSEKYDLLVGDSQQSLTQSMWQQGKSYYDENGKVENWMGICHGWAPAAIVEPRPVKTIEVSSQDQKWRITLNPSEMKGLVSYNWATNPYPTAFLGSRCNEKHPPQDPNGRTLTPECFDLNPSTWHLTMVHLVGNQKRSFVMDATFDYEVWNQPVLSYKYTYFNPQTRTPQKSLEKALVQKQDFTKDPYASFRSESATQFVGILMKVAYVIETGAGADNEDSPDYDAIRWVEYRYDLELDSQGEVIGGEWYTESHPDFIWVPLLGSRPSAPLDAGLQGQDWQMDFLPEEWSRAAQKSSPQGVILNTITEALLKRAAE